MKRVKREQRKKDKERNREGRDELREGGLRETDWEIRTETGGRERDRERERGGGRNKILR